MNIRRNTVHTGHEKVTDDENYAVVYLYKFQD